jgi:hypothetical protein
VEAALIARETGKPVLLTYTRWQEAVTAIHRPPLAAQIEARVDQTGTIAAWRLRVAMPSAAREFGARLLQGTSRAEAMAHHQNAHADPLAMEGFVPPYSFALAIEQAPVAVACPPGGCAAMAMRWAPLSPRALSMRSPPLRAASRCPTAWPCWRAIPGWRPVCSACRRWPTGTAAMMPAGRASPAIA